MSKAKVGDTIKILGFKPDSNGKIYASEAKLIGKTGVVQRIDPNGIIHGTWGELGILPQDEYEVVSQPVVTYEDVIKREG